MVIEQWGFFSVPYLLWQVTSACNGHSEDLLHSHLLPRVWQWSCHCLFLQLRSVATGHRTLISRMRGERSTSTPPRRFLTLWSQAISSCIKKIFLSLKREILILWTYALGMLRPGLPCDIVARQSILAHLSWKRLNIFIFFFKTNGPTSSKLCT